MITKYNSCMYISILGRQPELGIAELERTFGGKSIKLLTPQIVTISSDNFDIQKLGGTPKAGKIITELARSDWQQTSQHIIQYYTKKWSSFDGKITLGISVYGFKISTRDVQKTGIILKQKLKKSNVSLRLIPNTEVSLNTATSHHNKLGLSDNKVELLIVRSGEGKVFIAESTGSQNITAYAKRDQERPKRDAFVGMLPPKLAQIMINLAVGSWDMEYRKTANNNSQIMDSNSQKTILDPFCGTGVVLQEAAIMGYHVYGTDLSDKMIDYSRDNLEWLAAKRHQNIGFKLHQGDATKTKWQQPIDAVVCEAYLGQPFSAPPTPAKLEEVKNNCNHIISEFLRNLAPQIKTGTPLCIAVPAWKNKDGKFTNLPLISTIARLGYKPHEFMNVSQNNMLYYREDQVVARELLVLSKI